ncbi:GGDEF domain-containing protein [candidate division KSB1 bacterium]|nr:GGDEF domain-containing protein [candidate division KSB1 bacterium]
MQNISSAQSLIEANKELTQHLFELHNIFKVSAELTSIIDATKLKYTYLINSIGILRASGAILLLPQHPDRKTLTVALSRGFAKSFTDAINIPTEMLMRNLAHLMTGTYNILEIDTQEAHDILPDHYEMLQTGGIKLIAPLKHLDDFIGIMLIGESINPNGFRPTDFDLFSILNNFFATVHSHAVLIHKLKNLSTTDHLTQLLNRRAFNKSLTREIARSLRYELEFCLVLIDIDHFKNYNDTNGHLAGDSLLQTFAKLLRQCARSSDIISRFGGEEFAIILIGVDENGINAFCNRLLKTIQEYPFENAQQQPLGFVSASVGAAFFPRNAKSNKDLIACADIALYSAKNAGRNCVKHFGSKQFNQSDIDSGKSFRINRRKIQRKVVR